VRLAEGDRSRVTIEGGDPVEAARRFAAAGASLLHVVDLDGAFSGRPTPGLLGRIIAAVDARDGLVVAEGWTQTSALPAPELARSCAEAGVRRLLVTSTARDGSLAGPDLDLLAATIEASGLPVVAAGGIASVDDLRRLREIGCAGAVLGSALWSGRISLADALQADLREVTS